MPGRAKQVPRSTDLRVVAIVLALIIASAEHVEAQGAEVPTALPPSARVVPARPTLPGEWRARVVPRDTAQPFAMYLPSKPITPRPPVLFVLDPGGRAEEAMALFAPTAESLGWIVMSAARSMSDGPTEPNEAALGAMLDYAERSLRVNTQRLYIAGMSGTARAAWSLAKTYRVNVAGVIGAAASVTRPMDAREFADDSTFAAALTVGTADFNYAEVRTLRDDLARQHTPARVEWFNGPHGWMSAPAAARAMRWLELRAMLGRRRAVDTSFVTAWVTSERARGDSLLADGEMDGAEVAWREAASVAGLASQSMSHAADSLSAMRRLRDYRGALREAITEEGDRPQRMGVVMAWERIQPEPPAVKDLLSRLEVPALISQMSSRDSVRARSARRQLSYIVAMLSFYAPRAYEGAQQPARAARLREAAAIIRASR